MSSDEEGHYQRQGSLFTVRKVSDVDKSDVDDFWNEHQICVELSKGADGFGLTLQGGIDRPIYEKDDGIFITQIKKGSNAEKRGCLEVGDKVIEVNGKSLENMEHEKVVDLFRTSDKVRLVIHKNIGTFLEAVYASESPSRMNSPTEDTRDIENFNPVGFLIGIAIGCIVVFGVRRYLMKR